MIKNLKTYVFEQKHRLVITVFIIFVLNMLQVSIPRVQGNIIDALLATSFSSRQFTVNLVLIVALSLGIFACSYFARYFMLGANSLIDYSIRGDIFKHLLDLSMDYFTKNNSGTIMALSSNDLTKLRVALSRGLNMSANVLIGYILTMTQMFTIDKQLAIYVLMPLPIVVVIIALVAPKIRMKNIIAQNSFSSLAEVSQENISGMRVIKAFCNEKIEIERFKAENTINFTAQKDLAKLNSIYNPIIIFCSSTSFIFLIVLGGQLVLQGSITLGEFIACSTYVIILISQITSISTILSMVQQSNASWERLSDFFEIEPEKVLSDLPQAQISPDIFLQDIEFDNVAFSYTDKPVLDGFTATIAGGSTVGIIGEIGSGKSAIINLLLKLYGINGAGDICIGGVSIKDIPSDVLRSNIAYVPQDSFLFSDTIQNNIDYKESGDFDAITNATKISQVHETILAFPNGYLTKLGERGVNISGGQKQRISIARALVSQKPIIILDDALSAVDTETEAKILKGIHEYGEHKTLIMISHRLSTLEKCDLILVVDNGKVIESGTHADLIHSGGYYAKILQSQSQSQASTKNIEDGDKIEK